MSANQNTDEEAPGIPMEEELAKAYDELAEQQAHREYFAQHYKEELRRRLIAEGVDDYFNNNMRDCARLLRADMRNVGESTWPYLRRRGLNWLATHHMSISLFLISLSLWLLNWFQIISVKVVSMPK
ncbi:hypothetical protein BELL_0495g00050 [Botrytis elliptica]|uniref:Uncharacterized protein n=1 Tax=Botrytis elliptica TaxID=278938 RepID=A0A4Z1JER6_9HELO|nr:hypothetical protein BELL_0495g00050 [Botrytis elliptica]